MTEKRPWWFPVVFDQSELDRIRDTYESAKHQTDEEIHDQYNDGRKYRSVWDDTGDAYEAYEPLANDYLALRKAVQDTLNKCSAEMHDSTQGSEETLYRIEQHLNGLAKAMSVG